MDNSFIFGANATINLKTTATTATKRVKQGSGFPVETGHESLQKEHNAVLEDLLSVSGNVAEENEGDLDEDMKVEQDLAVNIVNVLTVANEHSLG